MTQQDLAAMYRRQAAMIEQTTDDAWHRGYAAALRTVADSMEFEFRLRPSYPVDPPIDRSVWPHSTYNREGK